MTISKVSTVADVSYIKQSRDSARVTSAAPKASTFDSNHSASRSRYVDVKAAAEATHANSVSSHSAKVDILA